MKYPCPEYARLEHAASITPYESEELDFLLLEERQWEMLKTEQAHGIADKARDMMAERWRRNAAYFPDQYVGSPPQANRNDLSRLSVVWLSNEKEGCPAFRFTQTIPSDEVAQGFGAGDPETAKAVQAYVVYDIPMIDADGWLRADFTEDDVRFAERLLQEKRQKAPYLFKHIAPDLGSIRQGLPPLQRS